VSGANADIDGHVIEEELVPHRCLVEGRNGLLIPEGVCSLCNTSSFVSLLVLLFQLALSPKRLVVIHPTHRLDGSVVPAPVHVTLEAVRGQTVVEAMDPISIKTARAPSELPEVGLPPILVPLLEVAQLLRANR